MSSYPGGYDALPDPVPTDELDSLTVPHAGLHEQVHSAVEAVQHTLGLSPQGIHPTVAARLVEIERNIGPGGGGANLDDLLDVDTTGAVPGNALVLDPTGQMWIPGEGGGGGDLTDYARLDGADFLGPVTVAPSIANGRVRNVWFLSSPPTDDEGENGDIAVVIS